MENSNQVNHRAYQLALTSALKAIVYSLKGSGAIDDDFFDDCLDAEAAMAAEQGNDEQAQIIDTLRTLFEPSPHDP